jgi:hypothetical protein
MKRSLFCAPLLVLAACATTHSSMSDNSMAKSQFETLRTLEGDWTSAGAPGSEPIETTFHVTGGGSAVEEILFKGSPHEMISMYTLDGDRLLHTHYCMLANQPRMVAKAPTQHGEIAFDFLDATNMASTSDMHMHSMRMVVTDKNHIEEWWQGWTDGKPDPDHAVHFVLTRKSPKA